MSDVVYSFSQIEKKWQESWNKNGLFKVALNDKKPKFYCLVMFPYPSSALHVGHGRVYIIGDVVARYKMMRGFNVLAPMGFDAFGLPAENAAIKGGEHPEKSTLRNIETMHRQFRSWGVGFDWDREVVSCLPDYYKWTQWFFLKMYEKGLAYKKEASVNWCPSCQTVLANEQVIDGECERCQAKVELRDLAQWFFKITDYAERLLDDMALLENWPERVKTMQRNWIGRSVGAEIDFKVKDSNLTLPCFTTRIDTIYGCTYFVLAAEHPKLAELVRGSAQEKEVRAFAEKVKQESKISRMAENVAKEGVFTGRYVVNPFTQETIPVWVANYVLMDYGTGAVMAVPTHDQRDFEFAQEYDLSMRVVIEPAGKKLSAEKIESAYIEDGILTNSGPFDGLPNRESMAKIIAHGEKKGFARAKIHYRLRDWLVSRQRYWGAPIPILYCGKCGTVPLPEKELPVLLPKNVEFKPTGESPLARSAEFVKAQCPKCGGPAKRETDTMDTFVDSSWYFLRYISPKEEKVPFVSKDVNEWLPVDQYVGGVEHAILHLLYSRFFTKFIHDLGLIDFKEPFRNLFAQGMIVKDGTKMSKSRGNVVSPDELIEKFGADTVRLYTLFIGPPEKDAEWNDASVEGCYRFLKRMWRLFHDYQELAQKKSTEKKELSDKGKELRRQSHLLIKKVTADIANEWHFNTVVASIMEFFNFLSQTMENVCKEGESGAAAVDEAIRSLVLMMAPLTPHLSEELWEKLGNKGSIFRHPWPEYEEKNLIQKETEVVLQVNGKVRGRIQVAADLDKTQLEKIALNSEMVQTWLDGKKVVKVIVVPQKLVNIVAQ